MLAFLGFVTFTTSRGPAGPETTQLRIQDGDSFARLFERAGLADRDLLAVMEANRGEMADWDVAFACDVLARAHAAAGQNEDARQARKRARAAGEAIADPDDRRFFFEWFAGGNWHGLAAG